MPKFNDAAVALSNAYSYLDVAERTGDQELDLAMNIAQNDLMKLMRWAIRKAKRNGEKLEAGLELYVD